MLVHHRAQLRNTWWDCFPPKIPKAKCSLAHAICITLWNPAARSQYRCAEEEGREENSMERTWKYETGNTWSMTNSVTKSENSKSLTVFQLRLTRPENWLFLKTRKKHFSMAKSTDEITDEKICISTAQETAIFAHWAKVTSRESD